MPKIDALKVADWQVMADNFCRDKPYRRGDVKLGSDAWAIANMCGILRDAYADRSVVDAHIQTAFAVVFPNAVFKDAKRY
jgi:hypothetical protein